MTSRTKGTARTYARWILHVSDLPNYLKDRYPHLSEGQILAILGPRLSRGTVSAALVACFQREFLDDLSDKFTASGSEAYWAPTWGNGSMHAEMQPGGFPGIAATHATLTVRNGIPEKCVLHYGFGVDHELMLTSGAEVDPV